jgi:predicted nuclease with TOPRIM domain
MENQTAVEWLEEKLWKLDDQNYTLPQSLVEQIEQAKALEKEQIMDAYIMGSYDMAAKEFKPEQYYNEIYNK